MSADTLEAMKNFILYIPYPSYIPRARGWRSTVHYGTHFKCKCTKEELDTVDAAVAKLGLSRSEFVRWVATKAALAVLGEHYVEQQQQPEQLGGQDYDPSAVNWDEP